jgi:hypothetical protein
VKERTCINIVQVYPEFVLHSVVGIGTGIQVWRIAQLSYETFPEAEEGSWAAFECLGGS